jgi:ATP-dependent Clp protease ATP-binding subunit ClpA
MWRRFLKRNSQAKSRKPNLSWGWGRFTEQAQRVVFFAQEEAERLEESYVSTEHLLLGLLRENDSVAVHVLNRLGVSPARIRAEVERHLLRGKGRLPQDMQLTPRAKRVMDLAFAEAQQMQNNYLGPEHLLLGLIVERDGLAGRVLAKSGVALEQTRREIYLVQSGNAGVLEADQKSENGNELAAEFALLPESQRFALMGAGLPLHHLPQTMWSALQNILERNLRDGSVILDPNGIIHVNVTEVEGEQRCTLTAKASILLDLPVK